MKRLIPLLAATAALLTSCVVEPGPYGYDSGYYPGGYYGGAYYAGGYYGGGYYDGHHHHHRPTRPYGTPWSSRDDVRLDANHRTSPSYRDPHNGGISHNHDAAGNRIDSRGHLVDAHGNHIGSSSGGSHGGGLHGGGSHSHREVPLPPPVRTGPPPSVSAPQVPSGPPPSSSGSSSSPVRNDKASHAQGRR